MMKWWKKLCGNHKGFSLVELICSMAILSIIMTSVGSAMVISARSYRNGNVELDLQQQAQIASNLLTNLIIDSDKVVQASDKKLIVEKVESGITVEYTIFLSGNELKYHTNVDPTERTLAENINDFTISRAEGENVDFSLTVVEGGRSYESDYHVTPRNGVSSGGVTLSGAISLFVENKLILEPGQTYDLNVRISGTTNTGFNVENKAGINSPDTDITIVGSNIQIKVGSTEMDSFHFDVVSAADPSVFKPVDVLIRRVTSINVRGYKTGGNGVNKAGAEYKVSAVLAGTSLGKEPGAWYDVDYVDPYTAQWAYEFTREDEYGVIHTYPATDYIEITGQGVEANVPYIAFKLKQDLTEGCKLRVTSTALHPEGLDPADTTHKTNKSGLKYDTVSGFWELEYSAWKRNGKIDIAIHTLTDADLWYGEDNKWHYAHYAWHATGECPQVYYWGYDKYGNLLDQTVGQFNPWTSSSNSVLNAETDGANIRDIWSLVLNPETDYGDEFYKKLPYSTPYFMTNITDRWITESPAVGYANRYNYPGFGRKDAARYKVQVDYCYTDEAGSLVHDSIVDEYAVEDVAIQYRNALSSDWRRDNIIYVTVLDSIEDYKVYFKFDKGWEGDDYYFSVLHRFVGIVADKPNNINDIRRDITVNGSESPSGVTGGNPFITFTLTAAEKAECKALTQGEGDKITVKYEYNPYFGKMNFEYSGSGDPADLSNYTEMRAEWYPNGLTQAQMDAVKGCAGSVVFYFKEPNITGATLKAMYCPTITEYGPVYYIDDTSRFVIAAGAAQYQELVGGVWVTQCNLIWDDVNNRWNAI